MPNSKVYWQQAVLGLLATKEKQVRAALSGGKP